MEIKLRTTGKGAGPVEITLGDLTIYFSYAEPVAYHHYRTGHVFSVNDWGTTTGRHMTSIRAHKPADRIPRETFLAELAAILNNPHAFLIYSETGRPSI
jgi:hypothetical protein